VIYKIQLIMNTCQVLLVRIRLHVGSFMKRTLVSPLEKHLPLISILYMHAIKEI